MAMVHSHVKLHAIDASKKHTFSSLDAAADGYGGVMVTSNCSRDSFLGRELLCIYIYRDIVYILCMDIHVYMAMYDNV